MTSSIIYSVAIIFGYETVKKWSVHEEYKPKLKWWFISIWQYTFSYWFSEKKEEEIWFLGSIEIRVSELSNQKIIVRNFKEQILKLLLLCDHIV